ncbi:flippase [Halarchaeum sp. P4]|uniref:flippase n=1 Tax=Halarchaeum sp. P4 TaxID=3421639 RepID=UPI003EBEC38E
MGDEKGDSTDELSTSDAFNSVRTVFKGGGIIFVGLILELGISFVGKLIIAQELGPVDYGGVSLGITTASIGSILLTLGLRQGIGRYLPRYTANSERRSILVSSFRVAIPASISVATLGVLVAPTVARYVFDDPGLAPILRIFVIAVPFGVVMHLALGAVQGSQRTLPKVAIQNITYPSVRFLGIIVAVLFGLGSIGVSYAYLASYICAAAGGIYYLYTRTTLFDTDIPVENSTRELLSFSLPLVVSSAMSIILADLDMYMLGIFDGTGAVGLYNVAYPLANLLTVGIGAFGFLFMPVLSEIDASGDTEQMSNLYQLVTKWIVFAMFPLFLVLVTFPEWTIQYTFGAEYVPSATALAVLAVGFFGHTAFGLNKNALTSLGYTRLVMIDDATVAACNVVLNLLLIPDYGLLGAAVATTLSYALLNTLYSFQLYRRTGVQPFTRRLVIAPVVGAAALWGGFVVLRLYWNGSFVSIVCLLTFAFIIYGVAAVRFGLDAEDVRLVLSFEERFDVDLGPVKIAARFLR